MGRIASHCLTLNGRIISTRYCDEYLWENARRQNLSEKPVLVLEAQAMLGFWDNEECYLSQMESGYFSTGGREQI